MAPAKTLYVREDDMPTWEKAETHAKAIGQSVSQIVTSALRSYLAGPYDIYVHIVTEEHPEGATFADSGGRPILECRPDRRYGHMWTIHTEDADDSTWPGSPDAPPVEAARAWLEDKRENERRGDMAPIHVEVGEPALTVEFMGRWLIEADPDETRTREAGYDAGQYWGVALTGRGRIAVYTGHCNDRWPPRLTDYDNLDQAARDVPADIIVLAGAELGEQRVVRRDI